MITHATAQELERVADSFREDRRVLGLCAGVVVGDELVWSLGLGQSRLESDRSPESGTLFAVASVTKTFTATAIVQLRDNGLLCLDDPLVLHIPELRHVRCTFGSIELVTLRHVLQHTSGLQGELPNRDPREWTLLTTTEVLASLEQAVVAIPPGTAYKYSNLGYRLLGEVVHRLSGHSLWEHFRVHLLEPLGMDTTTASLWRDGEPPRAQGHRSRMFDEPPVPEPVIPFEHEGGEGGLWSCVDDLARWVAQHLRTDESLERGPGQILGGSSLSELQQPTFICEEWTLARSLGWFRWREDELTLVVHDGHVGGFSSSVCFSPSDQVGAVVLANGVAPAPGALARKLIEIVRSLRPHEPLTRPASRSIPPEWMELLGSYRAADGWTEARVEAGDGRLQCTLSPQEELIPLRPTSDPLSFIALSGRPIGEAARFYRTENGAIAGLNLAGFPLVRLSAVE